MKKLLFFVLTAILLLEAVTFSFSQQHKEETLAYTGEMKVYCKALGGIIGMIQVVDGKGSYVQEKDEGEIALIYSVELDQHYAHYMALEKGTITVTVTLDSCIIFGGTPNNELIGSLDRKVEPLRLAIHKILHEDLNALDSINRIKKEEENKIKIRALGNRWQAFEREFALNNNSIAGLNYVRKQADKFTSEELGKILESYRALSETNVYKGIKRKYEASLRTDVGTVAPGFSLPTSEEQMISLTDVRGKVVLLDFWASWCIPCRKAIPHLKELYSEFHDRGLEIISISTDEDKAKWGVAMEEEKMPWEQLLDYKKEASKGYGITSIPQMFIIDQQGKILAKNLRGEALTERLQEIFSKK